MKKLYKHITSLDILGVGSRIKSQRKSNNNGKMARGASRRLRTKR